MGGALQHDTKGLKTYVHKSFHSSTFMAPQNNWKMHTINTGENQIVDKAIGKQQVVGTSTCLKGRSKLTDAEYE